MSAIRYLIIDDDEVDRARYKKILSERTKLTDEIIEFDNGREALSYLASNKVDIIFLDYQLTDINGVSLLAELKKLAGQFTPIIMLSGHGSESIAVASIKNGADDYIVKDQLIPSQFVKTIDKLIIEYQEKKSAQTLSKSHMEHLHYDNETGFFNYKTFIEIANRIHNESKKINRPCALLIIMLSTTKAKDLLSSVGIMLEISQVVTSLLPKESIVGRYGSHQLVVMISGYQLHEKLEMMLKKMISELNTLISKKKLPFFIGIGVACDPDFKNIKLINRFSVFISQRQDAFPCAADVNTETRELIRLYLSKLNQDGELPDDNKRGLMKLISNSEKALESSLSQGRSAFEIYNEKNDSPTYRAFEIELALHEIINGSNNSMIDTEYYPIFNSKLNKYIGIEVSYTIINPTLGKVSQNEIETVASKINVAEQLEEYVMMTAINHLKDFFSKKMKNYSGFTLYLPIQLSIEKLKNNNLKHFHEILEKINMELGLRVEFQVSLKQLANQEIISQLSMNKNTISLQVVIDDADIVNKLFNLITPLPITSLKISDNIIKSAIKDEKSLLLSKMIVLLSKHLNVPVLASRIDAIESYELLKQLDCHLFSGSYLSNPLTGSHLLKFLNQNIL